MFSLKKQLLTHLSNRTLEPKYLITAFLHPVVSVACSVYVYSNSKSCPILSTHRPLSRLLPHQDLK